MIKPQDANLKEEALLTARFFQLAEEYQVSVAQKDYETVSTIISDLASIGSTMPISTSKSYTFTSDIAKWAWLADALCSQKRGDGLENLANCFWGIFHPYTKHYCGRIETACKGRDCYYRFAPDEAICPACGSPRALCLETGLGSDGRCQKHSRPTEDRSLAIPDQPPTRKEAYQAALTRATPSRAPQSLDDANYLSLEAEIQVIGIRNVELLGAMQEYDVAVISARLTTIADKIYDAWEADDLKALNRAITQLQAVIEGAKNTDHAWKEFKVNARLLGSLVETERRRIVAAQEMMTVAEMVEEQDQIARAIVSAATLAARDVEDVLFRALRNQIGKDNWEEVRKVMGVVGLKEKVRQLYVHYTDQAIGGGHAEYLE